MQYDRIIEKAQKLGLNTDSIQNKDAKVKAIATALNFKNFNIDKDLNRLETNIDNKIYEQEKREKLKEAEDLYDDFKKRTVSDDDEYVNNDNDNDNKDDEDSNYDAYQTPKKTKNEDKTNENLERIANNRENRISNIKDKLDSINPQPHSNISVPDAAKTTTSEAAAGATSGVASAGASTAVSGAASAGAKAVASAIAPALPYIIIGAVVVVFFIIIIVYLGNESNKKNTNTTQYSCDGINFQKTRFSKEDFIAKLRNYYGPMNTSYSKVFLENAELIYDLAVKNNINPEIVVLRANGEGYSPSAKAIYADKNNYWGIGCYNGVSLSNCTSYNSFDEGVLGFINIIKDNNSLTEMMSTYAYIGDYWYNTEDNSKNTGLGGCYFFEYLKRYLPTDRRIEVESACAEENYCYSDGSGNCLKTNEYDQLAYTKYIVSTMVAQRKMIFGIDADECMIGSCNIFGQSNPNWGNIKLGNSNTTMSASGCAVTSIAIGISCSNTMVNSENFDPGVLVNALNEGNCFDDRGNISSWACSAINNVAPNVHYVNVIDFSNKSNEDKQNIISSYDLSKHFILMHYVNNEHPRGHFVVYTSNAGDYFEVKDPARGGIVNNVLMSEIDRIVIYSFENEGEMDGEEINENGQE